MFGKQKRYSSDLSCNHKYPGRDLNPHALGAKDFESSVSTIPPPGQIGKNHRSDYPLVSTS